MASGNMLGLLDEGSYTPDADDAVRCGGAAVIKHTAQHRNAACPV